MSNLFVVRPLLALLALTPVFAHFSLLQPPSIHSFDNGGKGAAPCGEAPDSNIITPVQGGRAIQLRINEFIFHPGHYRVALSVNSRAELPADPEVVQDANGISISAAIQNPVKAPVLADGLFNHTLPLSGDQEASIVLPNLNCDRCTLQVIEFMADHGFNPGGGYYYHHCADLRITADPSLPPADSAWPRASVPTTALFPHIANADGWSTVLNLVNPSAASVPVTIVFRSAAQSVAPVSLVLGPNASAAIPASGLPPNGWAEVRSAGPVGGYAALRYSPGEGPPGEGAIPLQMPGVALALPYDNSTGYETRFVLVNPAAADVTLTANIFDDSGVPLSAETINLPAAGSVFGLSERFPLTAAKRGFIRFQGAAAVGVAVRVAAAGSFLLLPPL